MHTEARYTNLQTENFVAKKIIADEITLRDSSIKSDVMMAGSTVKKLYENQPNTNAFDNVFKEKLIELDNLITRFNGIVSLPPTQFKLPKLEDINHDELQDNHAIVCTDETNIVYVCKVQNKIRHYTLPVYEPYVKVSLTVKDECANIDLSVI